MFATLHQSGSDYSGFLAYPVDEEGDKVYAALNIEPAREVRVLSADDTGWTLEVHGEEGPCTVLASPAQAAHIRVRSCPHCWMCGACHVE